MTTAGPFGIPVSVSFTYLGDSNNLAISYEKPTIPSSPLSVSLQVRSLMLISVGIQFFVEGVYNPDSQTRRALCL